MAAKAAIERSGMDGMSANSFNSGTPWTEPAEAKVGSSENDERVRLVLEKSREYANGERIRVYSYRDAIRANHVLYFAKEIAGDYGDEPVGEMWVELIGDHAAAIGLAHGASKVGLISPYERDYEASLLVEGAKAAWFDFRKTRASVRFDFEARTVTVEEFERRFPECRNGEPCEWLYFEDGEGNLYENNRSYNTWARVWPDAILTAMDWKSRDEKIDFIGTLKPVEDSSRVAGSVSFHRDSDDMDEEGLRFYAAGPDGKVREYRGLLKFQATKTGNYILMFTDVPKRWSNPIRLYASIYDPLQWRTLKRSEPGRLDLVGLTDKRDWDEVLETVGADGEFATLGATATETTPVTLPKGSLGLLGKARALMGL